jgi:hypothetical protein
MANLSTLSEAGRSGGGFAAVTAFARREPGKVLATVLGIHLVTWTLLPILLSHNLQLDLVEDLALGKEWQLGYWKNPSLPWWAADLAFRLTGQVDSVYLLGPLAAVLCFYAVWLLGRDILGPFQALVAVLILQGIHFYNYSIVKFAHDQMQLPFWAFTGLFFYRALVHARTTDWVLAGIFLGGAFWSKYAAIPLAVTLALFLLFDPFARRAWRTAGPIAMAVAFAIVIAPNVWWLIANDFLPLHYVNARAKAATHWYLYIAYPLAWAGLFFLLPAVGVALRPPARNAAGGHGAGGIPAPLPCRACAWALCSDHRGRRGAGAIAGVDVGLSDVVVCATRGAGVAWAGARCAAARGICEGGRSAPVGVAADLCGDRAVRAVAARSRQGRPVSGHGGCDAHHARMARRIR